MDSGIAAIVIGPMLAFAKLAFIISTASFHNYLGMPNRSHDSSNLADGITA